MNNNIGQIQEDLFPDTGTIFHWITDLCQWGDRKTGTENGQRSAEYISNEMKKIGLHDVVIENVPTLCMDVKRYELTINGRSIECFYINGTNHGDITGTFCFGEDGKEYDCVFVGDGTEDDFAKNDVQGKIVISSIHFNNCNSIDMVDWFEDAYVFDPDHEMNPGTHKTDIYTPVNWPYNYCRALTNGAVAFIGILEDYMDDPYNYNEDYSDYVKEFGKDYMSLPGLWISRSEGKALKELWRQGKEIKGKVRMESTYEWKDANVISGRLKGRSEDTIVVHSHHDAVFQGAVQDASGISEVLALASYFSKLPPEEREKSMIFAATDTHFTGYDGHKTFINNRKEEGINMVLDLCIEHIGKEAAFDDNMNLVETGQVETRLFYISKESNLFDIAKKLLEKYSLNKSILAEVKVGKGIDENWQYTFHQDEVISDAYYFNENGIPVVSHLSAQQYLFHPSDTPERIPKDELVPVGLFFAELAQIASQARS